MFAPLSTFFQKYPLVIWIIIILLGKEGIILNEEFFIIISFFLVAYFLDKNLSQVLLSALNERVTMLRTGYLSVLNHLIEINNSLLLQYQMKWRFFYTWTTFLLELQSLLSTYVQYRKKLFLASSLLDISDSLLVRIIKNYLYNRNVALQWHERSTLICSGDFFIDYFFSINPSLVDKSNPKVERKIDQKLKCLTYLNPGSRHEKIKDSFGKTLEDHKTGVNLLRDSKSKNIIKDTFSKDNSALKGKQQQEVKDNSVKTKKIETNNFTSRKEINNASSKGRGRPSKKN